MSKGPNGRNFPDFITAWYDYMRDGYFPDEFYYWMGIHLIGGALERRVWNAHDEDRVMYPNTYVFMVGESGIGKSACCRPGVDNFLRRVDLNEGSGPQILPDQMSEAALIESLKKTIKEFEINGTKFHHSSVYAYFSEMSNCLKEMTGGGSLISSLTDLYDSQSTFQRRTVKAMENNVDKPIKNVCLNLVGGCTFEHLRVLLANGGMRGGFASRIIYVVQRGSVARKHSYARKRDPSVRKLLVEDLQQIYNLKGPFHATQEYREANTKSGDAYEKERVLISDMDKRAILARNHTNVEKLSMLISASEGNELILNKSHWDRAIKLYDELLIYMPQILQAARNTNEGASFTNTLIDILKDAGGHLPRRILSDKMRENGFDPVRTAQYLSTGSMMDGQFKESVVNGTTHVWFVENKKAENTV